jgi:hypothetical protein
MLSGCPDDKHLLCLVENKQKHIPRSARDDMAGASFVRLLSLTSRILQLAVIGMFNLGSSTALAFAVLKSPCPYSGCQNDARESEHFDS